MKQTFKPTPAKVKILTVAPKSVDQSRQKMLWWGRFFKELAMVSRSKTLLTTGLLAMSSIFGRADSKAKAENTFPDPGDSKNKIELTESFHSGAILSDDTARFDNSSPTSEDQDLVGIMDLRGKSPRLASLLTASASNDAIVILYRGEDLTKFEEIRKGLSEFRNIDMINSDVPVNGIVLADIDLEFHDPEQGINTGDNSFEIYYDGAPLQARSVQRFPNSQIAELTRALLNNSLDEFGVVPKKDNSANDTAPAPTVGGSN